MDAAISCSGTLTISTFITKMLMGCFPRWQRLSLLTSHLTLTVLTRLLLTSRAKICFRSSLALGENTKRRVLHTFQDLNGDNVADLVIHSLAGRSLGKQRSLYEVHYGTPTSDGTVFAQDVSMTIRPRGTAGGLQPWGYSSQGFQDLNGNGKTDILFKDVKTGLVGMSRAMLGKSIAIDLEFYCMEDDGTYP